MKMFVANASLQRHQFTYRIPEQTKERTLFIESMGQIRLAEDLTQAQIDSIIEQHAPYGFISVSELRSSKMKQQTRLMYSIDKQISSIAIDSLFNTNRGILDAFGVELRKQSAVASNEAIIKQLQEQTGEGLEADVNKFELSVVEEEKRDGYGSAEPIAEGYRVERAKPEAPAQQSRRGRGR